MSFDSLTQIIWFISTPLKLKYWKKYYYDKFMMRDYKNNYYYQFTFLFRSQGGDNQLTIWLFDATFYYRI